MDQILDTIIALYEQVSALLGDYLLLAAGLGLVLILLLILLLARRRRTPFSRGDGDIEFLEVGPEPVIVYRRTAEQEQSQESPAQPQPAPAPEMAQAQEGPRPEPEPEPVAELPAVIPDLEPPEYPIAEPVLDPEPMPDAEPDSQPEEPLPAAEPVQVLPYLESELANNTLKLFSQQGFHIEEIVYQGIYGGDFIAVRPGVRAYVQVKDWKKKLTENAVSQVSSYAGNHNCNHAIIVTTAKFNRAAAKAGARLNVSLWNKKSLSKLRDKPIFPQEEVAATQQ